MAVAVLLPPPPSEFVEKDGSLTKYSQIWLQGITDRSQASAYNPGTTNGIVAESTAAIGLTSLLAVQSAGLYRLTWYMRVTTPATSSSSLQFVGLWTDAGVNQNKTGALLVGNAPTTYESDTILVFADAGTSINYAVNYATSGAVDMIFKLFVVLERL